METKKRIEEINRLIEWFDELSEAVRELLKDEHIPGNIREEMKKGLSRIALLRFQLEKLKLMYQ